MTGYHDECYVKSHGTLTKVSKHFERDGETPKHYTLHGDYADIVQFKTETVAMAIAEEYNRLKSMYDNYLDIRTIGHNLIRIYDHKPEVSI